ncbi:hypothetical protein NKG94_03950 [Micromonospora sp. M12]
MRRLLLVGRSGDGSGINAELTALGAEVTVAGCDVGTGPRSPR